MNKPAMTSVMIALAITVPITVAQFAHAGSASQPKLELRDWSVNASPNLAKKPPSKKIVNAFLRAEVEDYAELEDSAELCSYKFVDLRRAGAFSLVAGTGVAGRLSCRDIYIVDKTPTGFEIYATSGAIDAGGDISSSIEDLRKDGQSQFLVDEPIGAIQNRCQATWPTVYGWTGSGYGNVSDQFKDFYRRQLDSIKRKIASYGSADPEGDKLCLQAEAAVIEEFLGVSSDAGLKEAAALAGSDDLPTRYFAIDFLGHLRTPEARKYLETLANDRNKGIAHMANAYLTSPSRGPIREPEAFERVKQPTPSDR